jgi:hypothetical protein
MTEEFVQLYYTAFDTDRAALAGLYVRTPFLSAADRRSRKWNFHMIHRERVDCVNEALTYRSLL